MTELLVGLVINALLLLALAGAMSASTQSIENNDRYNRAVQQTRIALDEMNKEIRCAASITSVTPSTSSTSGWSFTIVDNTEFGGDTKTWTYVAPASGNPGYISLTDTTAGSTGYIGGTTSASGLDITGSTLTDVTGGGNGGSGQISDIGVTITMQIGVNTVTLAGSASPRCNLLMN
jgi:type II secretory pathway pseudopilin PulG